MHAMGLASLTEFPDSWMARLFRPPRSFTERRDQSARWNGIHGSGTDELEMFALMGRESVLDGPIRSEPAAHVIFWTFYCATVVQFAIRRSTLAGTVPWVLACFIRWCWLQ